MVKPINRQVGETCFPRAGYAVFSVALICLLALVGCVVPLSDVPPGGTQPLVKVGLAAAFEGLDRPLGYEALAGVKLALAERNAHGGVGGYMLELVALNDFGEPDEARLQAREFAADPAVLGVVTGWSAETARASLPVYQQVGLGVAVPWSVSPQLADPGSGIVLVAADVQQVSQVLAQAVAATYPQRLVVVGDETSAAPYVELMHALGLRVESIPPPGVLGGEIEAWATRLVLGRAQPPDVLVLAADDVLSSEMLLASSSLGWMGTAFGGPEVGSVHLVNLAGDEAVGLTFASPSPAGRDVLQLVEGESDLEWEALGPRAVLAYDATHVLLDAIQFAIQRDGYPSRQGVVAALPKIHRQGLTGAIAFDAAGRRVGGPVWLYQIGPKDYPGRLLLSPQASGSE